MTRIRFLLIPAISSLFFATGFFESDCRAQIREVSRVIFNDVGFASLDRQGNPYVAINPIRCRQLGPELCEFFRQHEYGHINLNHFDRRINTRQAEAEADCYAAKHVSPSVAKAASDWFQSGNGASRVHGSGQSRAARVATCSQREQPITAPDRSLTRRVTPSRRTYSANATSSSPTRTVTVRRSTAAQGTKPAKLVYVQAPDSTRTNTTTPNSARSTKAPTKIIYVRTPTSAQTNQAYGFYRIHSK